MRSESWTTWLSEAVFTKLRATVRSGSDADSSLTVRVLALSSASEKKRRPSSSTMPFTRSRSAYSAWTTTGRAASASARTRSCEGRMPLSARKPVPRTSVAVMTLSSGRSLSSPWFTDVSPLRL